MSDEQTRVGLAILVFKDGKFLLCQRTGSHGTESWGPPGGHIEFGESFEQTAIRETLEETGLEIKQVQVIGVTNDYFEADNKHYITIWTACSLLHGEPRIMEPDKCLAMEWKSFDSIPNNLFLPLKNFMQSQFLTNAQSFASMSLHK